MSYTVCLSPSNQDGNLYASGGTNEEAQCQRIADACKIALERCGIGVIMAGSKLTRAEKCRMSDAGGAHLHVPIHTNAGGKGAGGTRVFCWADDPKTGGYKASSAILRYLAPLTPGNVAESVTAYPGLYEIRVPKAPTAYVEVDFHDVPAYARWIIGHTNEIAEAICHGICDYLGVAYKAPVAPSEPADKHDPAADPAHYHTMADVRSALYRATLDKLVQRGILLGRGGSGEDRIIDLSEEAVRLLVMLDRAGVFGD